jgi:transmembrane sensor
MNITSIREIIDRYLQGRATGSEKKFIEKWLQARPEDERSLNDQDKQEVQAALWQSFTRRTDWSSFAADKAPEKAPVLLQYRAWIGYAAAIVVVLSAALWFNNALRNKQAIPAQTITALAGSHKTAVLPDSSIVHLFPGSSLTIPPDFNSRKRTLTLSGKVFFEVKSDPTRPFFVQTGKLQTQVLGTSFEVMTHDSLYTSVIVRTGKVAVQYNGRPLAGLVPGKRLRYDVQQNNFVVDEVNAAIPLRMVEQRHGLPSVTAGRSSAVCFLLVQCACHHYRDQVAKRNRHHPAQKQVVLRNIVPLISHPRISI